MLGRVSLPVYNWKFLPRVASSAREFPRGGIRGLEWLCLFFISIICVVSFFSLLPSTLRDKKARTRREKKESGAAFEDCRQWHTAGRGVSLAGRKSGLPSREQQICSAFEAARKEREPSGADFVGLRGAVATPPCWASDHGVTMN